jgi:hypothetical protein
MLKIKNKNDESKHVTDNHLVTMERGRKFFFK